MPLHHRLSHHVRHIRHRAVHHFRNAFVPHEGNNYHPHALRRRTLNITGATLIAVKVVTVVFVSFYAQQARLTSVTTAAIIDQTNRARQAHGVAVLSTNAKLNQAALTKARDMVKNGYFAHISPSKVTPWYWFKKAGYNYAYAGENLAIDFASSEDIIQAWLNSPSHRSNLLSARYKDIGVAVASGKINGAQALVVVQMFGAPVTPAVVTKPAVKQTPSPAKAKTVLTTTPPPEVLGEESKTAPATPEIESPAGGSTALTGQPTIVGRAEPGSVITLTSNGLALASTTVPADGVFSLTPTPPLPDGQQSLRLIAVARGLTSPVATLNFIIDTKPPAVDLNNSFVVPLISANAYLISVAADADTAVMIARSAGVATPLYRQGERFVGVVKLNQTGVTAGSVRIEYTDAAGNAVVAPLLDADRFLTGVAAAPEGPAEQALEMIFFSRAFMTAFFVLFFIVATMNIGMNWQRRHHPALLGMLLLLYVAGTLVIL